MCLCVQGERGEKQGERSERMIRGTIETLKLSEDWWRAKTSIDLLSGGKTPHFLRLVLLKHADDAGKQRRSQ